MFDDIIMDYMKRTQSSKKIKQGYDFVFTYMDTDMIYIYRETLQDLEWKKFCYECIDMPCGYCSIKINEVKRYWACALIQEPTLFLTNEVVDDCLVTFEKFQKQYIIIPSLSLNPLLLEEKPFITVRSPPGFFNQGKGTRCDLNATFQQLYYNVLFRELVFKINLYTMMNGLKR